MLEPKYPGAFEQLIDLSGCWDEHALFMARENIMQLSVKYGHCHEHCCRFLCAASSLLGDTYRIALEATATLKVSRAAQRIAQSEFHGGSGRGRESVRFLSAMTDKGVILFSETATTLCERIWLVDDVYGASSRLLLTALRSLALGAGWNVISCYCPLSPFEKLEHLFIPALRIGFMTRNDYLSPAVEPYKIIRSRRFTDMELLKKSAKRISFNKKAAAQMLESASKLLAEAKNIHARLEETYASTTDFAKVSAISDATLAKYEHILSQYEARATAQKL